MSPHDPRNPDNLPSLQDHRVISLPPGYEIATEPEEQEESRHLWDYIQMVWQRRWLVLFIFILCLTPAIWLVRHSQPVLLYQATAKIKIVPDAQSLVLADSRSGNRIDPMRTHVEILRSTRLAREVMEVIAAEDRQATATLEVVEEPVPANRSGLPFVDEAKHQFSTLRNWLLGPPPQPRRPADLESARLHARTQAFLTGLSVRPLPDSQVIELSYVSTDPDYSARVLNTLAEIYERYNYESKSEAYANARQWLTDKIAEMKEKLAESERALIAFADGNSGEYLRLDSGASTDRQVLSGGESRLIQVENEIAQIEYQRQKLNEGVSPALIFNDGISQQLGALDLELEQLRYQQRTLLETFTPESMQYRQNVEKIALLEEQRAAQLKMIRDRIDTQLQTLLAERDRLTSTVDTKQDTIVGLQSRLSQYQLLQREVDINRQLLDSLILKWHEIGMTQGVSTSNVSLLERAQPPLKALPTERNRPLLIAFFIGLVLSIGSVFFLNYMDVTFRSAEEISKAMRLPVMGAIPFCDLPRLRRRQLRPELIAHQQPYSGHADCYRALRSVLQFTTGNGRCRKVIVSSALPQEGKTTIASNLAVTFAQKGKRTLLIDADLKKPSLHKIFQTDPNHGLSTLLSEAAGRPPARDGEQPSPVVHTEVANLDLIPAGPRVPNPIDLLESEAMRQLLIEAEEEYDIVIIDSAPVIDIADTSVLGPHVDGVLMVMRPGKTPRRLACEARDRLMGMGARVLGVVINYPNKALQKRFNNYGFGRHSYGHYASRGGYAYRGTLVTGDAQLAKPAVGAPRFLLPPGKSR